MSHTPPTPSSSPPTGDGSRRSFLAAAMAIVTGAIAVLTPIGVGIASFLTPLFRKSKSPEVRVALLSQVPDDGRPRYFPVVAAREDAWTRYPGQRIGAVYLVRNPGDTVPTAFTAKCPHAGCFIGYTPGDDLFKCPCHTSSFKLDGTRARGDAEVAPRDMDTLPVQVKQVKTADGAELAEVWIQFIDYQTGHREKVATT